METKVSVWRIRMRKNWKKIVGLIMMATLLMSMVACNDKSEKDKNSDKNNAAQEAQTEATTTEEKDKDETIVITVLTDKTHLVDTKFAEYKAIFEADNENVEVQIEAVADYEKEVSKRLKSGDYGDVLLIPDSVTNEQLVTYFEPLGTVEELKETYKEAFLHSRTVDDVVYGLPRYANVQGIAYNEVVFAQAGMVELPLTSDEFLAVLKKIQNIRPETIPCYIGYDDGEWLCKWQTHAWGSISTDADYRNNGIVNEQDPFAKGTPNYIVHELLYDIVENGLSKIREENEAENQLESNEENDAETEVKSDDESDSENPAFRMLNYGEIGCMALSSDYLPELQSAGVNPDDISLMPFPYNIDGKQYASVELDYCYAVNKNSANKEIAKAWIDYMINKSGFSKSEGALSIRRKGSMPDVLANFKDVEFVVNNPATEENIGKYEELNELSCLYLDTDAEKKRLMQSALGESDEEFEDIMNDWSLRWKAAMQGIRYAIVKEPEEGAEENATPVLEVTPEYQQYLEDIIERMQSLLNKV